MHSDQWHNRFYDPLFASQTIGSKTRAKMAKQEVAFLTKILQLPQGAKILDVPCGTGRHAHLFAKKGYQVLGVDISSHCLKLAKRRCHHKNVRYRPGNMNNLKKYRGRFDAVLNLFTSFGYFSTDKKNEAVLKQLTGALKPGGVLVLSLLNRDFMIKHFKQALWIKLGRHLLIETRRYDPKTKYLESYFIFIQNYSKRAFAYHARIRVYSKKELVALMKKNGLKKIGVFGGTDSPRFSRFGSSHPYYIGWK